MGWNTWGDYVPVAEKKRQAQAKIKKLQKEGEPVQPVVATARSIATTFWGKAWYRNLESYSDYECRLPRGRSYLRQGAVLDLQVSAGEVKAKVMGSYLYEIKVRIIPLEPKAWKRIKKACAGGIASTIELLQGRLSDQVMKVITEPGQGLFPAPNEIKMDCSCPDWAGMCKHVAAVLYGVGVRLDERPELLFTLRNVDPLELIAGAGDAAAQHAVKVGEQVAGVIGDDQIADVFGIELAVAAPVEVAAPVALSKAKKVKKKVKTMALEKGRKGVKAIKMNAKAVSP